MPSLLTRDALGSPPFFGKIRRETVDSHAGVVMLRLGLLTTIIERC